MMENLWSTLAELEAPEFDNFGDAGCGCFYSLSFNKMMLCKRHKAAKDLREYLENRDGCLDA